MDIEDILITMEVEVGDILTINEEPCIIVPVRLIQDITHFEYYDEEYTDAHCALQTLLSESEK